MTPPPRPVPAKELTDAEVRAAQATVQSLTSKLSDSKHHSGRAVNMAYLDRALMVVGDAIGADQLVEPALIEAALKLVEAARRDVDAVELRLMTGARRQNMSWRVIAQSLGLQSPQAAAQRWERATGAKNVDPSN